MTWRLARGLEKLRDQVNEQWPDRSKASDGSVGDTSHSARKSDHNPDAAGVVHAIDITHDPRGGLDSYAFADALLRRQDHRLLYVISNRRIGSGPSGPQPGVWRPYHGANAHDHHVHVSIVSGQLADDVSEWAIPSPEDLGSHAAAAAASYVAPPATVRLGDDGPAVQWLQQRLVAHGFTLTVDGDFGPATRAAVRTFQGRQGLAADGIAGPLTWKALA
ncbi:peptidoglycan-binding protein [Bradyrhizobium sp. 83012]|uniref:Peptidoglycan-binding protein n=1 Tax=Bradyrhizobium aeschynomenes TaxID=2734909 RepID=A0ABX2C783_9BRAD|nr:peptidoglycan-binding domain-containing protein [Bradyrhizobium aeschynomenes]NPU63395.1 peptidoglycan-binding protein [Bradyrhizobium aeschynomenes]